MGLCGSLDLRYDKGSSEPTECDSVWLSRCNLEYSETRLIASYNALITLVLLFVAAS